MTSSRAAVRPTLARPAHLIGEVLGPVPLGVAVCASVGAATDGVAGLGWGLLAILFAAVLPYFATWRARHPSDGARPPRAARVRYLSLTLLSAAAGTVIVAVAGAPSRVVAVTVTILVGLLAGVAANLRVRTSNHVSAAAGGATMLVVLYGGWFVLAFAVVVLVGWSRVVAGRHSPAEVIVGGVLGTAVSALALPLLLAAL